ncbi:ScyD/ScyE family protein [Aeoliella sp. ICT_H6.2]|uniref:ScyD/ScyE family protein n=1 Tax=Aeoliella straminimaris TaxID=2954799 RepID=A0A9X2JF00_9BACT|nr:ScyD/ScyE family protein [Aeoliella straminimaris]MCO6042747.1 ScyD/ScyE family protein [Aeoliella straminimaris]
MKVSRCLAIAVCSLTWMAAVQQELFAATYVMEEVMGGLVSPRGLAWGPDGGLYVAEAGSGGDGPIVVLGNGSTALLGSTSGLSRLVGGIQERVLNGLPSVATASGQDAGGLQEIAFDGSGQAFGLFAFGADATQRDDNLGPAGAPLGTIARLSLDGTGTIEPIADIAAHERTFNPAGGSLDSNPFGMARTASGDFVVTDAGANDLLRATPLGVVSTLAVLPAQPNPLPFGPPVYQSVPTGLTIGPDDAYYFGQLTGFPFPPGAANVYRFDPDTNELSVAHAGFTNIIDLMFDDEGNLYVLQISSNGLASMMGPGPGALFKIDGMTDERTLIVSDGLLFPTSVLAGPDGALYVSNLGTSPGGGQVLRLSQVPEPRSFLFAAIGAMSLIYCGSRKNEKEDSDVL